jgi:hypothetical protein
MSDGGAQILDWQIMSSGDSPERRLSNFLQQRFNYREFSAFLRTLPDGDGLIPSLLPDSCPWREVVDEAVDLLRRKGFLDPEFFWSFRVSSGS